MRSVLVTGLSGLMGSRLQQLLADSYEFENIDLTVGVDITDRKMVMEYIRQSQAHAVIHLAAFTNVSAAQEQNGDKRGVCYQVNVVGTENVVQACKETDKYLIHVSTDYVFDGKKTEVYTEEDTPHPIEWYGQTKWWAEETVKDTLENFVILRIAYPYQAKPVRPDFIASMKEKLIMNTLPPAFTDHVITPVFMDDLVQVCDYCLVHQPTGLYHAVGSSWHSDYEVALMVKDRFGLKAEVTKGNLEEYLKTARRPYQHTMNVSNTKLTQDFGIKMKTLNEGLDEVIRQLT